MLFAFFLTRQRPHPIPFGPSTELHSFFNMSTCFLVPENVMRLAFHLCKLPGVFDFYRDPRNQEAAQLGGQIGRAILLQIESMVFDPRGKIPTCFTCIYLCTLGKKCLGLGVSIYRLLRVQFDRLKVVDACHVGPSMYIAAWNFRWTNKANLRRFDVWSQRVEWSFFVASYLFGKASLSDRFIQVQRMWIYHKYKHIHT